MRRFLQIVSIKFKRYRNRMRFNSFVFIILATCILAIFLLITENENNFWNDSWPKLKQNGLFSPDHYGPGEMGKPFILPANISEELNRTITEGWNKHYFNQYISDMISVNRSLPDYRSDWCKQPGRFLKDLPVTDIIICFHNEAWSTLIRTVHSVLNRSPEHLLGQIILVDDYSDMAHLKQPLDNYFASTPKVKILRATKREGLIRARLLGYNHSSSPIVTFLDSHCECTEGWLEPLLDRIARNSKTVVSPMVDIIDDRTFEFKTPDGNVPYVGGFNWRFEYDWRIVSDRERKRHKNSAEAMHTPTIAGGLFAIDRKFFEYLGTYDSGYDFWGAENLELSFKTWMCGGTLEAVFCSQVGHVYRSGSPNKYDTKLVLKNFERLAKVWLDDYAKIFYKYFAYTPTSNNVTNRIELRKRLGCKSFQWYLDNVFPEQFIPISFGEIINAESNMCLDAPDNRKELDRVGILECTGGSENQFWMITKLNEIRKNYICLVNEFGNPELRLCNKSAGNKQYWNFNPLTHQINSQFTNQCLSISRNRKITILEKCNAKSWRQRWRLKS